VECDAKNL
jgi:hypothetical protein